MPYLGAHLRELRAFEATARLASTGAAAAELGLSQPAISLALSRLEARLGCALLNRGPRGSYTTAEGARFALRAWRALEQLRDALRGLGAPEVALWRITDPGLAAIVAVAEEGAMPGAGRRLGIGAPALQRAARGMERAVGAALLRRGPVGLVPNAAGIEFARRLALARLEIAQGIAEMPTQDQPGRLTLATLPLVPRAPIVAAIGALLETLPGLTLQLLEGSYAELVAHLRSGRIDAILGALRAPAPHDDLVEERLFADPFALALRRSHPLAISPPDARTLGQTRWVVPGAGMPRRVVVEALFATLPARPRILLETSSLEMTIALLEAGDALALLSRHQIAAHPGLVALPGRWPLPARIIGLTCRRDWLPTPAQGRVLAALRAVCAQMEGPNAR